MPSLSIPYRPDDREISAGQRVLCTDGSKYNQYFRRPRNEDKIVFEDGEVDDTLRLMERVIHTYLDDTKEIAQLLHTQNVGSEAIITAIWDFLYHNIQYKLDKRGLEQLRRPVRSWAERHTGIDCDCFSVFASSILTHLGIPHFLRVTRYSQPTWQHVYVVVPKDGKSLANGYHTIDAVLARADYEKPFTAKKDYKMSLSGINIAVLSGVDSQEDNGLTALDVLMGFEDAASTPIGNTVADANAPHYEHELYKFLVATRQTIDAAPEAYREATGGNPSDMVKMLDYAIQYWYTDKRDAALGQLEKNEEAINTLNGFGAFNHVGLTGFNEAELYGDDDAYEIAGLGKAKGQHKRPSKFFSGIKKAVKKVNIVKGIVRFNPATIAIRNGFLLALKLNIGKMAEKMKWAYATPEQATAKRIAPAHVAASKSAVAKIEKMFTKLGGKAENLKKAVLHAKKGRLNGLGQLGVAPLAAGLAAAIPFIKMVMDVLKKSGLVKPGEKAELTPDGESTTQADRLISAAETDVQLFTQDGSNTEPAEAATATAYAPEYPPVETLPDETGVSGIDGLSSVFGSVGDFFKGNPGIALALTAGGAYMLYQASGGGSRASPGVKGLGSLHSHQRKRVSKKARGTNRKIPVYKMH
jgi:hypothetical protein